MLALHRETCRAAGLWLWLCLSVCADELLHNTTARDGNAAQAVTVSLRPVANVPNRDVCVADVATLEGGSQQLREQIATLDLADPLRAGQVLQVRREQIAYRIRIAGMEDRQFTVQGARSTRVMLQSCEVPEQEIVAAARRCVLARLPWNAEDISLQPAQPLRAPVRVIGAKEDVRLDAELRSPRSPLGRVRVDVAILVGGQRQVEVPIYFDVHLYQKIAIATRRIDHGQPLTDENVHFDRRTVDTLTDYVSLKESPIGQRAKRSIAAMQVITSGDLEPFAPDGQLVKQGDLVQLVAKVGALRVTATGEALQEGRSGKMIRVRNADSKTIVLGRVINRSIVEVLE